MALADAIARAAEAAPQNVPQAAPTPVDGRVLLVDGDYLAYYAAGNDECAPGRARQNAIEKIEAFKALSGATRVVNHLTSSSSNKGWRFINATVKPYQGQRDGGRKPRNWRSLRDWMETYDGAQFTPKLWTDREADDGMAYHATVLGPELAVIATADKDMRMFAGIHIDWKTYDITYVPPHAFEVVGSNGKLYGHKWFWQQMLQGDTADNIPGLPKYRKPTGKFGPLGEKTAEKFLAGTKTNAEAQDVVYNLYRGYYGPYEGAARFAEQATLLWMRIDREASVSDWLQVINEESRDWEDIYLAAQDLHTQVEQELENVKRLSAQGGA